MAKTEFSSTPKKKRTNSPPRKINSQENTTRLILSANLEEHLYFLLLQMTLSNIVIKYTIQYFNTKTELCISNTVFYCNCTLNSCCPKTDTAQTQQITYRVTINALSKGPIFSDSCFCFFEYFWGHRTTGYVFPRSLNR